MTERLPAPMTPVGCDCTDLDGFMLNVERLLGSELVALSSHEVIGAAMLIWCRAWKQSPAASLPDNDKVNAAFARMPLPRFLKLKEEILRGFVKCSDGRLYHKVLAIEAVKAFGKKQAFRKKREGDAERLRRWRDDRGTTEPEWEEIRAAVFSRDGYSCTRCGSKDDLHCDHIATARSGGRSEMGNLTTLCRKCHSRKTAFQRRDEMAGEMTDEMHFVAEGQGQGQGQKKDSLQGSKISGGDSLSAEGPGLPAGSPRVIAGGKS